MLDFLHNVNFDGKSVCETPFLAFQICCKCMQQWPSYGLRCDFQYGGRRHIGFCRIRVLRVNLSRDLILGVCIKFGTNLFKNGGVIAI